MMENSNSSSSNGTRPGSAGGGVEDPNNPPTLNNVSMNTVTGAISVGDSPTTPPVSTGSNNGNVGGIAGMGLARGRSKVWNEFVITGDGTRVTCKRCGDSLSYSHSHSTSSMLKHLKRKHHMDLYPALEDGEGGEGNKGAGKSPEKPKTPKKPKAKKAATAAQITHFQEEIVNEPSIQHDPLVFIDPCVRMRWADHSDTFLKTFSVMYNEESYTDCILVAEKQFFKAHRMVLSSASDLLDEMFKMTPAVHQPIIFLNNVKAMELRVLLDFIYKGEVAIPPNLIPGLVKVGSELKVKGLSDFVWNDQLASTIFPHGYSNNTVSSPVHTTQTPVFMGVNNNTKLGTSVKQVSSYTEDLVQKSVSSTQGNKPQNSAMSAATSVTSSAVTKTYGRVSSSLANTRSVSSNSLPLSTTEIQGIEPPYKRLKILEAPVGSLPVTHLNQSSNSFVTSFDGKKNNNGTGIPDTVLMVTNQGETVLSTSQGGVTLMTPNSISLPVSFALKDEHSLTSHGHNQYVGGQPVTILSSCGSDGHSLEEVVYSITEVPGGGHEVLMSGMDQGPIVVYDTSVSENDNVDKKLFHDEIIGKG